MSFDWRTALCADELYHQLMLSESLKQFSRGISSAVPVLLTLRVIRETPRAARDAVQFAQELLAEPLTAGILSRLEVPLACCALILSRLGLPEAHLALEAIAARRDPELGWAPAVARTQLEHLGATSVLSFSDAEAMGDHHTFPAAHSYTLRLAGSDSVHDDYSSVAELRVA